MSTDEQSPTEPVGLGDAGRVLADVPWPGSAVEPIFAEPWEGRAFGLAFDVIRRAGLDWEELRQRLITALAEAPERPYYESWLNALERLTTERVDVSAETLSVARNDASWYRYHDATHGDIEVRPFRAADAASGLTDTLPVTAVGAGQIELYRSTDAATPCGVRAFAADGSLLADVAIAPDQWAALRERVSH